MKEILGLSSVKDHFDGFILDLWGLIHDGVRPYEGVVNTFVELKKNNIKTVLLSNAPRRSDSLVSSMELMGINRGLYNEIYSSGEATWEELIKRSDPFFSSLGKKVFHIGPDRDNSILEQTDIVKVKDLVHADFILNTGPSLFTHTLDDYELVLRQSMKIKLPMVCANPDEVVIRDGKKVICAGLIAKRYSELGGKVVYRGKPDPRIYELSMEKLNCLDKDRIAIIGDSLDTDIAGAKASGIKSIWCTGGIHAKELGVNYGAPAKLDLAKKLAAQNNLKPWSIIPGFYW